VGWAREEGEGGRDEMKRAWKKTIGGLEGGSKGKHAEQTSTPYFYSATSYQGKEKNVPLFSATT
jgi:hypothetical protein